MYVGIFNWFSTSFLDKSFKDSFFINHLGQLHLNLTKDSYEQGGLVGTETKNNDGELYHGMN